MTRPCVYLYDRATAMGDGLPEDVGWWFQCFPCPARWPGAVDEGPFATASLANYAARKHVSTHHKEES